MSKEVAKMAAAAQSDLSVFAIVASIMEGSFLYRSTKTQQAAARKIVAICQAEQQRCLREYDARLDDVAAPRRKRLAKAGRN